MKPVQFRDVFDLKDDDNLKDIISLVAARLVTKGVDEIVANPVAMQMICGYMTYLFNKICQDNGITLTMGDIEGEDDFYDIHKETKH